MAEPLGVGRQRLRSGCERASATSTGLVHSASRETILPMTPRTLDIGDPVRLPSGRSARVMVAAIPNRPWVAVAFEGRWAVRREHDAREWPGYAGLDETDARALARLLNQVGVE